MADTKISALTAATDLVGAEMAGIQSSTNKRFGKALWDAIYQALLVSGTNIKTIGGATLLGSGELITGTPSGSKYLRDDLSWQTVTATAPDIALTQLTPTLDQTITANYGAYVPEYYEIASGTFLECGDGGIFEIG
jgi:hypothetical protein